jgi:hypothetical protein
MKLPRILGFGGLPPQGAQLTQARPLLPTPNSVTNGVGAPTNTQGVNTQFYYDTSTTPPTLYQYESGTWVQVGLASASLAAGENIQLSVAAGVTTVTSNNTVHTVATLPALGAGKRSFVSDSTQTLAAGLGTAVVGGGTNKVPVYSDGTSWLIG